MIITKIGEMVVGTGHVGERGGIWIKCCQIWITYVSVRPVTQANVAGGRPDVGGRAGVKRAPAPVERSRAPRFFATWPRSAATGMRAACALRNRGVRTCLYYGNVLYVRVQTKPYTAGTTTATWKPTLASRTTGNSTGAARAGRSRQNDAHDLNTRLNIRTQA
jgi:hypothetical protein